MGGTHRAAATAQIRAITHRSMARTAHRNTTKIANWISASAQASTRRLALVAYQGLQLSVRAGRMKDACPAWRLLQRVTADGSMLCCCTSPHLLAECCNP